MTVAANDVPQAPATPTRRFFSDEQKLAIVKETEQPGVTVSSVARKHGIVTGLLFRWRAQFGGGAEEARKACFRRVGRRHGGHSPSATT